MTTDNIAGKVVLITGGSSGLGEATARYLAAQGAKVAIAARRRDRLDEIVSELTAQGQTARAYTLDVTKRSEVEETVAAVTRDFGRLDVLVNNAGLMAIAPIQKLMVDEWDRMIDINIKGVLYGVAAALPVFEKQKSGHVINLSSVAGLKVFAPGGTVYSGTKFAVRAISEGLRQEAGNTFRVTSIEPGAVQSELKSGSGDTDSRKTVEEFYKMAIPADSVARAIAFAISQPDDVDINEIVLRPTRQEF
ncbi:MULTISPECIES: SDR family oxidoreductase [Gluconobacter]|uniref:Oxidoreductase n=1 Tax=Gluconobacter roseus NBRC 3990 TaxID=1307950 RepID=A0A4Y3M3T2_9PROT|nr:SDR family oxidoreductase [Gluconobacter roseus]KXV44766.1 oxidoreductase [Gluconobacter roseus]GBR45598.1 oxidoreductase [Gluconobacter roseus NBRC 3990]GEB03027.1 oxidoreductase [Gluconobacter roseus NBRC 3990]GLP93485.1 oxidoreductase [Gluconobacter roseus NBRC 3990]